MYVSSFSSFGFFVSQLKILNGQREMKQKDQRGRADGRSFRRNRGRSRGRSRGSSKECGAVWVPPHDHGTEMDTVRGKWSRYKGR